MGRGRGRGVAATPGISSVSISPGIAATVVESTSPAAADVQSSADVGSYDSSFAVLDVQVRHDGF